MAWTSTVGHGGTTHIGEMAFSQDKLEVAIFLPDRFRTAPGVDMILYYHGWTTAYGATNARTLLDYEKNRPIRAAVGAHGRYALVMPWLGTKPNRQTLYKTITASPQSLADFLAAAVTEIAARSNTPGSADPANCLRSLILAAHSGGGTILGATIPHKGTLIGKAVSAWCLDCFYSVDTKAWDGWLTKDRSLHCYWTISPNPADSTQEESEELAKALKGRANAKITKSAVGHPTVPAHYFPILLEAVSPTKKP